MTRRRVSPDVLAVAALIALWLLFFWRLFTPIAADQASLTQGDFSGQFVTFAGYQYDRFAAGEIPLWNPYNNGGFPFIADTQAAVFYPPRLITIAFASLSGGWTYHALELEMTAHVLAYTLMMYAFVRRLTIAQSGSVYGALAAAIIAGYGGFLSGYPPLQLALLEAAVWLPLALFGIHEATRDRISPAWLVLTGVALGISWMAGHPQTSFFITYVLMAYWGYHVYLKRWKPIRFVRGAALFGLIAFGLAAVQLIPGVEYLSYTTRAAFGYDAKANGFPIQDVMQFVFPGILSQWSPLYIGVAGLILAWVALWRERTARFWGVIALVALLWSFGGNSLIYPALYQVLPGLRFFRGQERAAYVVVTSLAIMGGLGGAYFYRWSAAAVEITQARRWLHRLWAAAILIGAFVFVAWLGFPAAYGAVIAPVTVSVIVISVIALLVPILLKRRSAWRWLLIVVLVIELFTVNMGDPNVYDSVPPSDQLPITPPPLIASVSADTDVPFRVDGFRGLTANFGSLYGIADIRGISPLFLDHAWNLIEGDLPDDQTWELFGVRYVFTDWNELPVASVILDEGEDVYGAVNLHRLENPRPFALVQYQSVFAGNDSAALEQIRTLGFQVRNIMVLDRDIALTSDRLPTPTTVTTFTPERIVIEANAAADGIVSVALIHYPGWSATLDGQPVEIMRAYSALSAVVVPSGTHTVELIYNPLSYGFGAVISIITWVGVAVVFIVILIRRISKMRTQTNDADDQ